MGTGMRGRIKLGWAIAVFVLLDFGTLAFGYTITALVAQDAVAINLAGRQRMLSQRVSKATLIAVDPGKSLAQRQSAHEEARLSYALFIRTLQAFAQGGETLGGAGEPVQLDMVHERAGRLVGEVLGRVSAWPGYPDAAEEQEAFAHFWLDQNLDILSAMNQLTTELERQSLAAVSRLRVAQGMAFVLSLINFFVILLSLQRERREMERQAQADPLTGLLNRGGIYQALGLALEAAQVVGNPLGVMLFDLDGFKAINDTYGHAAGDKALQEVARRLRAWGAEGWQCGRLGGDEFVVICPGVTSEALAAAALQLEQVLSGIPCGVLVVSASVGWAAANAESSPDSLMSAADAGMYAQKAEHYAARRIRAEERHP